MSTQLYQDILALTTEAYRPCAGLDEQLGGFLKAAMAYVHAGAAQIKVRSGVTGNTESSDLEVYLEEYEEVRPQDTLTEDSPHVEAKAIGQVSLSSAHRERVPQDHGAAKQVKQAVATPILYHQESIGEVISKPTGSGLESEKYRAFQEMFARELAFFIMRHQANSRARLSLGKPMLLVGASSWLRRVDHFIERASAVDFPVIIAGAFGTEKSQVACAIHFSGNRREKPLVELSAHSLTEDNFCQRMAQVQSQAQAGTIFLNEVDQLTPSLQNRLAAYIQSGVGQWLGTGTASPISPRWIASVSENPTEGSTHVSLTQSLIAELDFLKVRLAPLVERPQDVPALIGYALTKYRCNPHQGISSAALGLLENYHWPENAYEIERVVARLATLGNQNEISADNVRRFAPQVGAANPVRVGGRANVEDAESRSIDGEAPGKVEEAQEEAVSPAQALIRRLLQNDYSQLNGYHLGLQRALRHLAKHFHEELSLADLSEQAFMSASHLSHLFKSELGESFKGLLNLLRIEKAQQMLTEENEMRITDIAFEAGFGDLSHFTKTFKKISGCNPKDFRLKYGEIL